MQSTVDRILAATTLAFMLFSGSALAQVAPTGNYTPDPDPSSTEGSGANGTASSDPPGLFVPELSMTSGGSAMVTVMPVGGTGLGKQTVSCNVNTTTGNGNLTVSSAPAALPFTMLPGGGTTTLTVACAGATLPTRGLLQCNENPSVGTGTNVTVWFDVACGTLTAPEFSASPAGGTPINLSATVGGSSPQVITVSNIGTAALTILPSGLTPPLTVAPATQQSIAPLGNTPFTVTCAPTSVGASTQTLSFDTNDADEDPVTYQVTCTGTAVAAPQYASTPTVGSTILISAQVGSSANGALTISNPGTQPLTAALSGLSGVLAVTPGGPFNIAAAGNQPLTITCTPASATTVVQTLSVDHNDNDGAPPDPATYTVQCTGTSAPQREYTSVPAAGSTITLAAAVAATDTDIIAVSNTGGAGTTLTTSVAGFTNPPINVTPAGHTAGQGETDNYTISCTPAAVGRVTQTITITSDDVDEPTNIYTINCDGLAAEFVSVPDAPGPITLAAATGAATATATLTISNDAAAGQSLTYGAPTGLAAPLSIAPAIGGTLAPGNAQVFTISCATGASGLFTGTLNFTTNDPNEASVNFNVSCNIGSAATQDFASVPASPGPITITVGQNGLGTANVLVSNAGGAALGITAIAISGVDAATFSVNPNTATSLAAGAQQNYVVTCNTGAIGTFNATLTYTTDDADELSVPFTLTCTVGTAQPALSSNPPVGQSIALTDVIGPTTATQTLTVTNTGSGALDVSGVSGLSGVLSIAPAQQIGIAAGASRNFTITCDPVVAATVSQTLTLTTNATPATYDYPVSCTGTNAPAGEFDPNVPNGNTITINTTINQTGTSVISVLNSGNASLSTTASITAGAPQITVAPTTAGSTGVGLTRAFTVSCLSAVPGVLSGTLNFATNDPDETSVNYPVTCVVADVPPDINVAPVPVTINALAGGAPQQATLTITNTAALGGNTLTAVASGLSNPLSLSQSNFTLAPQASANFNVICTPIVIVINIPPFFTFTFPLTGTYVQTLSFDTNDPDEDPASYTVTCNVSFAPAPEYASTPDAGQTITLNTLVGVPVSANLQVQNTGSAADTVVPSGLSGILAIAPNAPTPVPNGGSVDFTITCSPTVAGSVTQTLSISSTDLTDNEAVNNYTITCNAGIAPEPELSSIPISGSQLIMGGAPGSTVNAVIGISNSGVAVLRIQGCSLVGAGLTLTSTFPVDIDPLDSGQVAFSCVVPAIGLPTVGSLTCQTNDLDEGTITFPISCAGGLGPTEFIPTMSEWSRALLALMLVGLGLGGLAWRRRMGAT